VNEIASPFMEENGLCPTLRVWVSEIGDFEIEHLSAPTFFGPQLLRLLDKHCGDHQLSLLPDAKTLIAEEIEDRAVEYDGVVVDAMTARAWIPAPLR
jgi:hypothetical protein